MLGLSAAGHSILGYLSIASSIANKRLIEFPIRTILFAWHRLSPNLNNVEARILRLHFRPDWHYKIINKESRQNEWFCCLLASILLDNSNEAREFDGLESSEKGMRPRRTFLTLTVMFKPGCTAHLHIRWHVREAGLSRRPSDRPRTYNCAWPMLGLHVHDCYAIRPTSRRNRNVPSV